MALAEKAQHRIPREEIVLPVVRSSQSSGRAMYPGDALNIVPDPDGIAFVHRRHGVTYGRLDGYLLEGQWSAKVGDWALSSARLIPVETQAPDFDANELERCDKHGRVGCSWCVADSEREAEHAIRLGADDRAMIEEAQS